MSRFRFCKDTDKWNAEHDNDDWDDGLSKSNSLREIAYQLKRIADKLGDGVA